MRGTEDGENQPSGLEGPEPQPSITESDRPNLGHIHIADSARSVAAFN